MTHSRRVLIGLAALIAVPGTLPAQSASPSLGGEVWVGQYWPGSDGFYQVVQGDGRAIHYSGGRDRDGGYVYGVSGSVRPAGWPVGFRLSLGHMPAGEALLTASNHIPGTPIPLIDPPPVWTVTYRSDLDIYSGTVTAAVRSLPALGPVQLAVRAGVTVQRRDLGTPVAVDTLRPGQIPDGYDVRERSVFTGGETRPGLYLGSELSTRLLGTRLRLELGDFLTVDATSDLKTGVADTRFDHDLYLRAGVGLD